MTETEDEEQQLLMDQQPKRFIPNGIEKGLSDFIRSTRLSEFLGGPGKRYSYLVRSQGSPGYMLAKKLSEFLGGPGKKRPRSNEGYFTWLNPSRSAGGFPEGSEFLGGPGRK